MAQNRPAAFNNNLRMGGEPRIHGLPIRSSTNPHVEIVKEKVQDGVTGETREIQYTQCKIVGNGSFGVVFQTKLSPTNEDAAIKRVLQDKRFKVRTGCMLQRRAGTKLTRLQNRELQIMRIVRHPNIVQLKAFYYSNGERVCFPTILCAV